MKKGATEFLDLPTITYISKCTRCPNTLLCFCWLLRRLATLSTVHGPTFHTCPVAGAMRVGTVSVEMKQRSLIQQFLLPCHHAQEKVPLRGAAMQTRAPGISTPGAASSAVGYRRMHAPVPACGRA